MKTAPLEARFRQNGSRIRRGRRSIGASQEAFAARIGTTRRHMIRLEKGHHLPSSALRDRMVAAIEADGGTVATIQAHDDEDEESDVAMSVDEFLRRRVRALMREESEPA